MTTPPPSGAERPVPAADAGGGTGRDGLRLHALLSAIALAVLALRAGLQGQAWAMAGLPPQWAMMLGTGGALWLGWTLWAGLVVAAVRHVVEHPAARARASGALVALAVAPVAVVPLMGSPAHLLLFEDSTTLLASYLHMARHNALINLLLGATFVGVVHAHFSRARARHLEVQSAQLAAQLTQAQLDALRAQLDPHFLFNALNSIAVLARRGRVDDVEQMVTRLAGLLRHSLESARTQEVPLRVELEALRHYLAIEQVRHGDRLVAEVDVEPALHDCVVPSFVLQPLAENAIRHGFTDPQRPLHVAVRAHASAGRLVLTVEDDGDGVAGGGERRDGIGLGTTKARLEGLYGARGSLELSRRGDGRGTRVTVTLPDDRAPRGPAA